MAILQLPKQQRHPDVEEFIFSHFNVPTFTVIDERYRSYRVNMAGVDDDQVIDLALVKFTEVNGMNTGVLGYILNSAYSLIADDFLQESPGTYAYDGFRHVNPDKEYQGFNLYWRPQKKDPFEWLHEKGFHVVAS